VLKLIILQFRTKQQLSKLLKQYKYMVFCTFIWQYIDRLLLFPHPLCVQTRAIENMVCP